MADLVQIKENVVNKIFASENIHYPKGHLHFPPMRVIYVLREKILMQKYMSNTF